MIRRRPRRPVRSRLATFAAAALLAAAIGEGAVAPVAAAETPRPASFEVGGEARGGVTETGNPERADGIIAILIAL